MDLASNCEIVIEQILSPKFENDHLRERSSSIDLDQEEFWLGRENVSQRKNPSNFIRIRPPIAVYVSLFLSQLSLLLLRLSMHPSLILVIYDDLSDVWSTSCWKSWWVCGCNSILFAHHYVLQLLIFKFLHWTFYISLTAFKTIYKQRVPHTFRVVTEGDAFTSMPTLTCFGGIYRHAGLEVLLDEGCTGNILVGPTVVETLLRFTKVRTSVANHSLGEFIGAS